MQSKKVQLPDNAATGVYKLPTPSFPTDQMEEKDLFLGHPSSLAFHSVTVGRPTAAVDYESCVNLSNKQTFYGRSIASSSP